MVRLIPASKRGLPAWILAGVRVTAVLGQEPRKSQPSFPAFVWKSEPPADCPFEHSYMKSFGEQGYFVNLPSKFIGKGGRTAWLCYSGNFAPNWNGEKIQANPPGTRYGLVLQQIRLLTPEKP